MNTPPVIYNFSRIEFKYLLHHSQVSAIREYLLAFGMKKVLFKSSDRRNSYRILSLYFDTPTYRFYYEKLAGNIKRQKYRLRRYLDNDSQSKVFCEIKLKNGPAIHKIREEIDPKLVELLMQGGHIPDKYDSNYAIYQFTAQVNKYCLRPTVVVAYEREPLSLSNQPDFRVTFDSKIMVGRDTQFWVPTFEHKLLPNHVVMEVKFRHSYPFWFGNMIKHYNLQRVAYSKYCSALEKCVNLSRFTLASY